MNKKEPPSIINYYINYNICDEAYNMFETNKRYLTFTIFCEKLYSDILLISKNNSSKMWINREVIDMQLTLINSVVDGFGFNFDDAYNKMIEFFETKKYTYFEREVADVRYIWFSDIKRIIRKIR